MDLNVQIITDWSMNSSAKGIGTDGASVVVLDSRFSEQVQV